MTGSGFHPRSQFRAAQGTQPRPTWPAPGPGWAGSGNRAERGAV